MLFWPGKVPFGLRYLYNLFDRLRLGATGLPAEDSTNLGTQENLYGEESSQY